MSEIEKMYENAGIKPIKQGYCDWDSWCPYEDLTCGNDCPYWKYEDEAKYPPFTAEKQLELIKLLARKDYGTYAESLLISIRDGYNYLSVGITTDFGSECFYEDFTFDNKQFDEAIAGLINKLWQDLTEEEKEQIREILR